MNKTTEALKLAEEALESCNSGKWSMSFDEIDVERALAAIREALADHPMDYDQGFVDGVEAQLAEPVKQEPVARPFECWSTNDGDSWFEHPADAQLIYDVLGDDPKVGDEFEVSAGWNCVTATYQIASKDGDDFEVKCVSHQNNDTAPVSAKAIRAEALEEAAKVCEKRIGGAVQNNEWWSGFKAAMKQCAAAIRSLK